MVSIGGVTVEAGGGGNRVSLWTSGVFSDVNTAAATGTVVGEEGSFRHVIGLSVFWDTPVGPLQFNFSKALRKEIYDIEQTFEISLRTTF